MCNYIMEINYDLYKIIHLPNGNILLKLKNDIEKKKTIALQAGGLYVIGTERHESRRIDNQLRGRTGRQGDPGGSKATHG